MPFTDIVRRDKADNWWMRFHDRALNLKWKKGTKRADKSNAIDLLCSSLVPEEGIEREDFERHFEEAPQLFTLEERRAFLKTLQDVSVSSDAFVSVYTTPYSGWQLQLHPWLSNYDFGCNLHSLLEHIPEP